MAAKQQRQRYVRHSPGLEFDRFAFFSDAVFAIAMTLLVVGIGVPHVASHDLEHALSEKNDEILSFFISFLVIGYYWLAHHRFIGLIDSVDTGVLPLQPARLVGAGRRVPCRDPDRVRRHRARVAVPARPVPHRVCARPIREAAGRRGALRLSSLSRCRRCRARRRRARGCRDLPASVRSGGRRPSAPLPRVPARAGCGRRRSRDAADTGRPGG